MENEEEIEQLTTKRDTKIQIRLNKIERDTVKNIEYMKIQVTFLPCRQKADNRVW